MIDVMLPLAAVMVIRTSRLGMKYISPPLDRVTPGVEFTAAHPPSAAAPHSAMVDMILLIAISWWFESKSE
ncbi:hypothetical protein [Piscinibacter sp. XHJ-5]|uniref:hypothetical protein n=1 Tax=Piscinibacter sp. XHJ-5 TaxID=3037797 RepID=UPI0024531661|nr:hypothetical protein [Piscinibacter sp. XHJ-5]